MGHEVKGCWKHPTHLHHIHLGTMGSKLPLSWVLGFRLWGGQLQGAAQGPRPPAEVFCPICAHPLRGQHPWSPGVPPLCWSLHPPWHGCGPVCPLPGWGSRLPRLELGRAFGRRFSCRGDFPLHVHLALLWKGMWLLGCELLFFRIVFPPCLGVLRG